MRTVKLCVFGFILGGLIAFVSFKNNVGHESGLREDVGNINNPHSVVEKQKKLLGRIVSKYRVDPNVAHDVIKFAYKYERDTFPKAKDILAVVGIESSWNPNAVSKLKKDPAVGLTQIRPGIWKSIIGDRSALRSIENQIKFAAHILHWNYKQTKNRDHAIIAYNVGIGAFSRGEFTDNYLNKFKRERETFNFGG